MALWIAGISARHMNGGNFFFEREQVPGEHWILTVENALITMVLCVKACFYVFQGPENQIVQALSAAFDN